MESDLPSTLDNSTIYAITDSGETEIEKLIIRGMEFAGGGIPDTGEPMISSPSNGTTINLGTNEGSGVSKTITVKGKNLTGDLTVAVGTGLTISYGQSTGQSSVTIPMAQALLGAQVTIAYSGTGALDDGSLVISHGGSVLSSVVVVVEKGLPAGYTRLNSISGITDFITTNINSNGTTWEFDVVTHQDGVQTQILAGYGSAGAGQYGGACITGKWGLGTTDDLCTTVPYTQRSKILIAFTSQQASMTIGDQTITRAAASASSGNLELLGFHVANNIDNYKIRGTIYSVKCIAGASFDGVPAERNSDNKQGIYDLANDVFYPLK